jgi:hypothetical protein
MAKRVMRLLTAYFPESGYVIEDVLAVEERLFYNLLTTQNYLERERASSVSLMPQSFA